MQRRAGIGAREVFAALLGSVVASTVLAISPQDIGARVEAAALRELERQADAAEWVEPRFDVTVVTDLRSVEPCPERVEMEAIDTRNPARMRFRVSCAEHWRQTFVVRADVSARVVVAAVDVAAHRPLTAADLDLERRSLAAAPDALGDVDAAVGLASRRRMHRGDIVRRSLLHAPTLVRRGDAVNIVAQHEQILVTMAGEALDAGARGDIVRVRNAGSGKVIRARVIDAGEVEPTNP